MVATSRYRRPELDYSSNRTTNINKQQLGSVNSVNSLMFCKPQITKVVSSIGLVIDTAATIPPKVYFIDSKENYNILAYSFHRGSGKFIDKSKIVFNWKKQKMVGYPRRLTVDKDGNLWVPLYDGHGVIQVNPKNKEIIKFIPIPAHRVGACTFGGANFDILFVSTIGYGHGNDRKQRPPKDEGGSIFALMGLGVQGWPPQPFKLGIFPAPKNDIVKI
ncbi:regucalcin-like [Belonocnema kinseyi]|uniref:regucalcin-like n=1 Tax=Belonocnema kinseyi TaxID=2817044 RepID=UPI00143CFEBD|nr:regucalcin-like [Belonocnema kinseyi]